MEEFELILPNRSPRQPQPSVAPGGDCGGCVLSGLTRIPVKDVYAVAREDKKDESFSYPTMRDALYRLCSLGHLKHIVTASPIWPEEVFRRPFGYEGQLMSLAWFDHIRVAIEARYYAVCEVAMRGRNLEDQHGAETDHWVLLCGVRIRHEPNKAVPGAMNVEQEVLVSDSATSMPPERWVEVNEFLKKHGGFQAMLAKPKE